MTDAPSLISDVDAKRRPSVREIQEAVASAFGVRLIDMTARRRAPSVARPRQVAMYLARELTLQSIPEIGLRFDRDRTTVMHACDVIPHLAARDRVLAAGIDAALARLRDAVNEDQNQLALPLQAPRRAA